VSLVKVGRGTTATRLHVEREGSGEPLLWITGFAISSELFSPVIHHYAAEFHCIRYDNRGAGRSAAPWRLTSIPELAGDAVRLLDALGVDSAHVYGLSMGGMVAQEVAIRFPDRVRALVLGGTTHGGPQAVLPSPRVAAALGSRGAPADVRAELVGRALFSEGFRREHPELVRAHLRNLAAHRATARGLLSHWWASVYHDTRARLGRIAAPTLVLHGGADELTPVANARTLAERIADATLVVLPGVGHGYLLEQPEQAHRAFTTWLAERSPVPAGRPLSGLAARTEPLSRHLGLQVGALRTARSLAGAARPRRTPRPR
jgi:pimeloyl-ACP methyl ester carboxylesterase